jgi:hypothetical protein
MSENSVDALPVPFSTELLGTRHCLCLSAQLNDLENAIFGPDFACNYEQLKPWVDSGCLFYAAVCGEAVEGRKTILSEVSVFVTTSRARDRLIRGAIPEHELEPWTNADTAQPTLYFSSVVSDSADHLAMMYTSLLGDIRAFRDQRGLTLHSGFGIASGRAGCRHMMKNGFRVLQGVKYRNNYEFLVIDASTAATPFWQNLLESETLFIRKSETGELCSAEFPSGLSYAND